MNEWLSAKEIAKITGITERAVQIRAQKENWQPTRPRQGKGGGREYHVSSLPEETRISLITAQSEISALQPEITEAWLASRRISLSPAELADPAIQRKLACARLYESCLAYRGKEKVIAALATEHNVSPITIRRWIDDIAAMRTRTVSRITLGQEKVTIPRSNSFTPDALAYALSTYANNVRSGMRAAYTQMQSIANARHWQVGDYSSFTRIVKKIPSPVWAHIRRGATGFELACVPKIVRQWTAVLVQSVLCGDQKIFDYEVYDPALSRIIIPNGYFWMDCSSRMVSGVWLEMGHYNSHTVGNALREALRFGIPDEIFTDWGKPEGSKHIAGILKRLSGHVQTGDYAAMAERFGDMTSDDMEHRKAQPGKPWMKPIENIMNILDTMMEARFVGGFRKRNNDAWVNKITQHMLKRDRRITPGYGTRAPAKRGQGQVLESSRPATAAQAKGLMTIEEFVHTVFSVVEQHNKTEKKLKEGGVIIPGEFFARGLTSQQRPILPPHVLDYICMPQEVRTPQQSVVKIKARHDDERGYYSPVLVNRHERVRVSYNPYDREAPAILTDLSGNFLDHAEPWHVQNPYDREGITAKRHRQAELMKWVGEQARRVKDAFGILIEDAPLGEKYRPTTKIIPASAAANEAHRERKIYEIRKDNTRLHDQDIVREANHLRDELKRKFATEANAPAFEIPPEGKARYVCYLELVARLKSGEELPIEESTFVANYPGTDGYRNEKRFHDRFGELYIRTRKPGDADAQNEAVNGQATDTQP